MVKATNSTVNTFNMTESLDDKMLWFAPEKSIGVIQQPCQPTDGLIHQYRMTGRRLLKQRVMENVDKKMKS